MKKNITILVMMLILLLFSTPAISQRGKVISTDPPQKADILEKTDKGPNYKYAYLMVVKDGGPFYAGQIYLIKYEVKTHKKLRGVWKQKAPTHLTRSHRAKGRPITATGGANPTIATFGKWTVKTAVLCELPPP